MSSPRFVLAGFNVVSSELPARTVYHGVNMPEGTTVPTWSKCTASIKTCSGCFALLRVILLATEGQVLQL